MLFQTSSEFSSQLPPGVSGVSLNHADFTVRTSARNLDPRAVMDLLSGRAVVHHVKGFLDSATSATIARNARDLLSEVRSDVPAVKVGADHFGKSTEEYLHEVAETRAKVDGLFAGAPYLPVRAPRSHSAFVWIAA